MNLINYTIPRAGDVARASIISNYENELKNFVQVCPIEMLDKLDHPISLKELKSKSA